MCLAVPMKILSLIDSTRAIASQASGEMEVDIALLESVKPGDYVIVHAGYALEVLETDEAESRIEILEEYV